MKTLKHRYETSLYNLKTFVCMLDWGSIITLHSLKLLRFKAHARVIDALFGPNDDASQNRGADHFVTDSHCNIDMKFHVRNTFYLRLSASDVIPLYVSLIILGDT